MLDDENTVKDLDLVCMLYKAGITTIGSLSLLLFIRGDHGPVTWTTGFVMPDS